MQLPFLRATSRPQRWAPACRFLSPLWVTFFLAICISFSSGRLPNSSGIFLLALTGLITMQLVPLQMSAVSFRISAVATVLSALIVAADLHAAISLGIGTSISPQAALLLCIAPLSAHLGAVPRLKYSVAAFALILSAWHVIALPLEAITGFKWGWNLAEPIAREAGVFRFQAAGLAHQAFYFAGFFLPLFYLGLGEACSRGLKRHWCIVAAVVWVLAVSCVQSRSALAGAVLACAMVALAERAAGTWRNWVPAAAVLVLFVGVYLLLFSENKSGPGLRWLYFVHYVRSSFDGWGLITGHGFTLHPPLHMTLPIQPLSHSHSDIAQVLYAWGLPALLTYVAFLGTVMWVAWLHWKSGDYGYGWALVALAPNMVTDLGIHHYEKAAFLTLVAGMSAAYLPSSLRASRAPIT